MTTRLPTFSALALAVALAAVPIGAHAQSGADTERFNRIENTMRNLTGQVEQLSHQVRLLQEQIQRMQEDTNFRFSEMQGEGSGDIGLEPLPGEANLALPGDAGPLTNDNLQLGAPPQPLGTLTMDAPTSAEQPLDLSTLAGGDASNMGGAQAVPLGQPGAQLGGAPQMATATGDPRMDYEQAYGLIRAGRYDLAENAFRTFLASYPSDDLAPEAQYWLGESFFARGDYGQAAKEFSAGYKAYPGSRRGADTLLKLGLSMAGLGYRDEACQMYTAALKNYPDMSNGLKQRVINEQASAGC